MKIINLIVAILSFIMSVNLVIQDVRKWKSEKKEKEFDKRLEELEKKRCQD